MESVQEMKSKQMSEKITVAGQVIELRNENIPIEKLRLDEDNPRIRYRLKLEQNGKSLADVINTMPEVAALRKDIETNGGLRQKIIVQPIAGGDFKVVEGNVRLTCISVLHQSDPQDYRWKTLPARILPDNVNDKIVAILLSDEHVVGKIGWAAHEKAGQIYHMTKLGISVEDVAIYLRSSKRDVNQLLQAYSTMMDVFLAMPEYKDKASGKFSYFEQLYKKKQLRDRVTSQPSFKRDFCRWVGDGKIPEVIDLVKLIDILAKPTARKKFEETTKTSDQTYRAWFDDIFELVEMDNPEKGDGPMAEFFRVLKKTKDHIGNLSFENINHCRSDEAARNKIMETYESVINLMNAIELPVPGKKKAVA